MSGRTYVLLVVAVFVFSSIAWGALFSRLGVRELESLAVLASVFGAICMTGFLIGLRWYLKDGDNHAPETVVK